MGRSLACLINWPSMGLFCHSSVRDFDVLSMYTCGSSSSLIKPSSHAVLSHSSWFIFRYYPRPLFSALTHSSKLSRPFPPSLHGKYSLSAFDLGCSGWYMFSTFLVFLSILRSSEFFQSTMSALYLITGTAHVLMAFTVFPELSFDFNIAFNLFIYSFFYLLLHLLAFYFFTFYYPQLFISSFIYVFDVISIW